MDIRKFFKSPNSTAAAKEETPAPSAASAAAVTANEKKRKPKVTDDSSIKGKKNKTKDVVLVDEEEDTKKKVNSPVPAKSKKRAKMKSDGQDSEDVGIGKSKKKTKKKIVESEHESSNDEIEIQKKRKKSVKKRAVLSDDEEHSDDVVEFAQTTTPVKESAKSDISAYFKSPSDQNQRDKHAIGSGASNSKVTEEVSPESFFASTKLPQSQPKKSPRKPKVIQPVEYVEDLSPLADELFDDLPDFSKATPKKLNESTNAEKDIEILEEKASAPRRSQSRSPKKIEQKPESHLTAFVPDKAVSPKKANILDEPAKEETDVFSPYPPMPSKKGRVSPTKTKGELLNTDFMDISEAPSPYPPIPAKKSTNGKQIEISGKRFVLSGDFQSRREDVQDMILEFGGKTTTAVSSQTNYLIIGQDPGPSKLSLAKQHNTIIISEFEFLDAVELLRQSQGKSAKKVPEKPKFKQENELDSKRSTSNLLWVDQFKPTSIQQIIGNNQSVKSLVEFLENWNSSHKQKAALISGPPGIGKTTTATLVSNLCGYEVIEFNASDTRNQKSLDEHVSDLMDNRTITEFQKSQPLSSKKSSKKQVLVMDEVDGMSSGDRGGIAQLNKLIKTSKIPVICICNDRSDPKMRTLANNCLDLRFRRPTKNQIATKLLPVIMKAGFDIDLPALEKLCESCHSDIRLVINTLQFWSTETNSMTFQEVKKSLDGQLKDVETSPFEVVGSFFERIGNSKNWFNERIDHYFVDMSLVPLMVQEKFAVCSSDAKGLDIVQKIAEAAESISQADLLDNQLRSTASFSLLPLHAALSCVIPGAYVSGFGGRGPPTFPSWLGKNSTRRKNIRLFTEMKVHMSRICTGNAASVQLDYCPVLRSQLLSTLASNEHDSIEKTIEMLDTYGLDLEDFETIQISPFSSQQAQKIETKVKTQLTKAFKKLHDFEAGRRKRKDDSGGDMGLAEENDDMIYDAGGADDEEEGNSENETEIEAAKPKSVKSKGSKTTAAKSSKSKPSSSSSSSKKPVSSKKLK